jgi:hypothetical protein
MHRDSRVRTGIRSKSSLCGVYEPNVHHRYRRESHLESAWIFYRLKSTCISHIMATVRSGYEAGSSLAPAACRNSEVIELDSINHLRKEATKIASTEPPVFSSTPTSAMTDPAYVAASTPRRTSIDDYNTELSAVNLHHDEAAAVEASSPLPPVDTGKDAWLFLSSAFVMDILVWSISFFDFFCALSTDANTTQVSPLRTASSRSTTPHTRRLRASETLPSSVPALWDSCTSLRRWSLACSRGIRRAKSLVS